MISACVWSKPLLGVKLMYSPVAKSKIASPAFTSTMLPLASGRCQKMPALMAVVPDSWKVVLTWSTSLRV
jgi:hypothetical protein